MRIEFYKPNASALAQTWLVVIGDDVFEMSTNARMPNGVNMYFGERSEFGEFDCHELVNGRESIPHDIAAAAIERAYSVAAD